jgi:hypothetical protein
MSQNGLHLESVADILASTRRAKIACALILVLLVLLLIGLSLLILIQLGHTAGHFVFIALIALPLLSLATGVAAALLKPEPRVAFDPTGHRELEDVAQILTQFPGPVTIRGSKPQLVAVSILVVPMLTLGILGFLGSMRAGSAVGFLCSSVLLLFSALIVFVYARALQLGLPSITLDSEGFSMRKALAAISQRRGVVSKRWSEASGFRSYFDAVQFSDQSPPTSLSGGLTHVRGMLPNTVLGAKPLARLMNMWRERSLSPQKETG